MRKLRSFFCLMLLCCAQLAWSAPEFRDDHPESYTVVKGDTLWAISSRFLTNPWYWPEIWHANPHIENPHLIYPGDKLSLVYIDGQRRLTVARRGDASRTVKLSPTTRISPLESAIPAISLEAIGPFLTNNRIVSEQEITGTPYVLQGKRGNIVVGAGDAIYARGQGLVDHNYGIYRPGRTFIDPVTEEFLGIEARSVAVGKVIATNDQVLTVDITRSSEEIRIGDRLMVQEDRTISATFFPSDPSQEIHGQMIAVVDGVTQIGQFDVVVINRGANHQLTEGNILAVYKAGDQVRDPITEEVVQLPSDRAGILMIFRVFDKLSYGIVLKAERPLAVFDEVKNP